MTQLVWVLFWLQLYAPFYYTVSFPYSIESRAFNTQGEIGGRDTWCDATTPPDCKPHIYIDIDAINQRADWGAWDKTVIAACLIAHEWAHIDTKSADEIIPLFNEYICLDTMPWAPESAKDFVRQRLYRAMH